MVGSRRDRSRAAVAICDNERLLLQRSAEQRSAEQHSDEQHSDEQRMTSMASMRQMLDSVAMDDTSMSSAVVPGGVIVAVLLWLYAMIRLGCIVSTAVIDY